MAEEKSAWTTGLSLTGAAALFLALRLFAVAHYDWHTAFAVADTIQLDDAASVVIGTLMADRLISGAALMIMLPIAVVRQTRQGNAGNLAYLITLAVATIALVRTYGAWWVPVGAAVLAGLLLLALRERRQETGGTVARWLTRRLGLVTVIAALVVAATVRTPWAPLERIATTEGTVYGYVLDTPPGYLKVLVRADREMVTLETAKVTGRVECPDEHCRPGR